jgi:predicted DNA-binding transcriptional regulator AlpA
MPKQTDSHRDNNTASASPLLTEPETAARLHVGVSTVRKLQRQPDFPKPRWIGERAKRFLASEIDAWMHAQTARPAEASLMSQRARLALQARRARLAAAAQPAEVM